MSLLRSFTLLLTVFVLLAIPQYLIARQETAPGQATVPGRITGRVIARHSNGPIVGAAVEIPALRKTARTDAEGRFVFEGIPAGVYDIAISATGYARSTSKVTLPPPTGPGDVVVDATLDLQFHSEPVVVTASPNPRDAMEVYQPTTVLGPAELEKRASESLGTTLQNEPGISTTSLGTAPARPVIRGMGGDRVLILEDGTRSADVSSISPDHAVAIDPSSAQSIEIVRGPANLLYGSNATGGVINVLNDEIPSRLVDRPTGSLSGAATTNAEEFSGNVDLSASAGPVGFRAGGSRREAGEFHFPRGVAGNSQYDFDAYHGGVSLVGTAGFVGVGYRHYQGTWGIPVSEDGFLLGEGEAGVTLDMEQESYKLTGQVTKPFGPFTGARFQGVRRDYTHTEFEDTGEPGTRFDLTTSEFRSDITHKEVGRFTGTFGAWLLDGDFTAEGDEALVKEAKTRAYAGFFYEELGFEHVKLLFGGRYDTQRIDPGDSAVRRDFSSFSGAVGAILNPAGKSSVAINLTRNFKAPSAEELYANGPHIATFAFEVGDANLDEETSVGADLSYRWKTERFHGEVTAFRTQFNDFIFLQPTGVTDPNISDLEIAEYRQADAVFTGFEAHADVALQEHLTWELTGDQVHATNTETDRPLPLIPPYRVGTGLSWDKDRFGVGGEARYAGRQGRVADGESRTADYMLYGLFGSLRLQSGRIVHRLALRGENLTNRLYRNHVSLVKEIVPQPGRIVKLTYTMLF